MSIVERAVALVALLLLLPFLALIAILIAVLSRQGPLVAHRRVGRFGVPFWMLKFRTMWNGQPRATGLIEHLRAERVPEKKNGEDPRVTSSLASFCRKHSIDELPQ